MRRRPSPPPTPVPVADTAPLTRPPARSAAAARVRRLAREPASWAVFLAFWGVVTASWVGLAVAAAAPRSPGVAAAGGLVDGASWMLTCVCGIALAVAVPLDHRRPGRAVACMVLAGAAVVVARVFALQAALGWVGWTGARAPRALLLVNALGPHLVSFLAFVGAGHAVLYALDFRERQLALARAAAELSQARFQALRTRLHPGFLLDAFEGVAALIPRDVRAADRMLLELSELLRRTLRNSSVDEVALAQEVDFVGRYLELLGARSGAGPRLRVDAAPEALAVPVPPGVLFRVLEAGMRAAGGAGGTRAELDVRVEGGTLRLRLRDDVAAGLELRRARPEWEEVELLSAVLEQRFGAPAGWTFADAEGGGVRGELVLPLPREGAP